MYVRAFAFVAQRVPIHVREETSHEIVMFRPKIFLRLIFLFFQHLWEVGLLRDQSNYPTNVKDDHKSIETRQRWKKKPAVSCFAQTNYY